MKQSIILGTALAFALSVAPAMAGNLDALKIANGTSMTASELASVEGKKRKRGGIYVGNSSYVNQRNVCYGCGSNQGKKGKKVRKAKRRGGNGGVYQNNYNSTYQSANLKIVYVNVRVGGHGKR